MPNQRSPRPRSRHFHIVLGGVPCVLDNVRLAKPARWSGMLVQPCFYVLWRRNVLYVHILQVRGVAFRTKLDHAKANGAMPGHMYGMGPGGMGSPYAFPGVSGCDHSRTTSVRGGSGNSLKV
eukprot:3479474-Amphidinium_carterae.1